MTTDVAEVVLDASVWVARLVPDDLHHDRSRSWLERHVAEGGVTVAPALILPEIAGPVARRTGRPALGRQAGRLLRRLPGLRLLPIDRALAEIAEELAAALRLRGADAVYVGAAKRLGIPLVTWDGEQLDRAHRAITVCTPS